MVKVDLITGFLGSGKTTFIKKYAAWLMKKGLNIGILENDFGAVNVDMMLLHDLEGENCELEMVSGGCDKDCHKRRFKTKLIAMGMCGYDRVLIEPSGVFDVDEFFDTLYEEPLDKWYQIGNVITILDARLEKKLQPQAEYLLASEAADAGCVVLSKTQEASQEEISETLAHVNQTLESVHCKRRFTREEVLAKDWETLTDEDFERIFSSGYVMEDFEKKYFDEKDSFQSLYFMNMEISEDQLKKAAEEILEDPQCGTVFRIKGFIKKENGDWVELNATQKEMSLQKLPVGQEVVIVIGEKLNEARIQEYWAGGKGGNKS
ncbi:MAG: GTP-binding protein [Blautia sp.]